MTNRLFVAWGVFICGLTCAVMGDERFWVEVDGNDPPVTRELANRIEWTLRQAADCHFEDQPLEEVLKVIEATHHIPIWIDKQALQDEGINTDTQVTLIKTGISLEVILRLTLEPFALTYVSGDGLLKITTMVKADEMFWTRIYPVSDLVAPGTQTQDYELLVDLVMKNTGRAWFVWADGGGTITPFPNARSLVIHQTQEGHRQIEGLLVAIRKAKRLQNLPSPPAHRYDLDELSIMEAPRTSRRSRTNPAHDVPAWQRPRVHSAE